MAMTRGVWRLTPTLNSALTSTMTRTLTLAMTLTYETALTLALMTTYVWPQDSDFDVKLSIDYGVDVGL